MRPLRNTMGQWWGYRHINGGVQVKPYHPTFGEGDMDDAHESPFVKKAIGPFDAESRNEAVDIVAKATA